jgi:hypothetical protein
MRRAVPAVPGAGAGQLQLRQGAVHAAVQRPHAHVRRHVRQADAVRARVRGEVPRRRVRGARAVHGRPVQADSIKPRVVESAHGFSSCNQNMMKCFQCLLSI